MQEQIEIQKTGELHSTPEQAIFEDFVFKLHTTEEVDLEKFLRKEFNLNEDIHLHVNNCSFIGEIFNASDINVPIYLSSLQADR